jgi:hypothetical protein
MKPRFATIKAWCQLSGMSPRNTYRHIAWNNLKAHKVGARTLIDVDSSLAWIRSQPAPKIKPQAPDKWLAKSQQESSARGAAAVA